MVKAGASDGRGIAGKGLVLGYPGGEDVVHGVDVGAAPGRVLALIGPNGAGKSTLLRGLCGILAPRRGAVLSGTRDLATLAPRERARRVALLPQDLALPYDVTVARFVAGGRYPHRGFLRGKDAEGARAMRSALEETELLELVDRPISELSGGQRQRVMLARALAQDAHVLLVDEPTASLDPRHQIAVFDGFRAQARRGRAVVVVTHDLNLASQYADELVLLREGRVVIAGAAGVVLDPAILHDVYGEDLLFGVATTGAAAEPRPWAVPWKRTLR